MNEQHFSPASQEKKLGSSRWLLILIAAAVLIIVYRAGYESGSKGFVFQAKEFKVINQNDQAVTVDYSVLWDALKIVNEKYIDQPVDQKKILYGAVKGAVEAVGDPYTTFMEPKILTNFKTDLKGSFDGIGAEIGKRNGYIVIVAPIDGSPAKRAGLLPKDIIAKVNDEVVNDWTTEQAVEKIRGPKGTKVVLTIVREGKEKPFEVTIVRDKIEVKSVKWEIKDFESQGNKKKIAVITLSKFGDDTNQLFARAVSEALVQKVDGIVIDLRNNPGGYLQTAVDLASEWLDKGQLVVTEARSKGDPYIYSAEGGNKLAGIKTVILINGGSASASEILSGALHDHNVAKLIGEKSYGKGSVQELVELKEGGAVKVTIAKWITPNGKNLNKDGLVPDIEVKLTEDDINAGRDPQMDKAIEELIKQ